MANLLGFGDRLRLCAQLALALLLSFWAAIPAMAAELAFNRIYQGGLSGQTFSTTALLNADPGSIRFADGGTQRAFQNTSGTLYYTVGGVPYAEIGVLNSRFPNGNTLMDAVAFSGTGGDRLLALGSSYASSSSYSGSSNAIVAKLNEYIGATAPDPAQTTLSVNGGSSASITVGQNATIVVTVKLASGGAMTGATVALSASPSGTSSISPGTATTNSSGQASFTVQSTTAGTVTYYAVATANGTTTTSTGSVTISYAEARSPAQSSAIVPAGTVGIATTVTVMVRDSGNTSVVGAASALSVTIGGANAGASPSAIVDSGGGNYRFTYVPTVAGTDSVAIQLDGTPIAGSPHASVVTAPTLSFGPAPGPLPGGTVGTAYSETITTSGGAAPYTYAATGLPTGLSIDVSTGRVSGTPTTAGTYPISVNVTDANGSPGSASYSIVIAEQSPIANAVATTVAANSSSNPVVLNLTGAAAASVAIASQATHGSATVSGTSISYTPAAGYSGIDSFTYTATNGSGTSAPATVTITVTAPALVLAPGAGTLPVGAVGTGYSQTFSVTGGTAPYSFTATGLPAGLIINSATGGVIGTPTAAGSFPVSVAVTDAYGATGSASYSLVISPQAPTANPVSAAVAANSSANPIGLIVTGGAPVSVALASQPAHGLATTSGTSITYSPAPGYSGSDSFSYTATNASGTSAPATISVTVTAPALVVMPGTLPDGMVGAGYTRTISASGGTAPYVYAASGLPPGLTLNASTGAVTGAPTVAGSFPVGVSVTDANSAVGSTSYTITVSVQAPVANNLSVTVAANSASNSVTLPLSGGSASSIAIVTAPLHGTFVVSGTAVTYTPAPGYSGADSFTYTASNGSGTSAPALVSVNVAAAPLVLATAPGGLPDGVVGTPYSQTISATGGAAPYSFTATGLPPGLTMNAQTGAVSGTPTNAGTYPVNVNTADAYGATGSAGYTVRVAVEVPIANVVSAEIAANSTNNPVVVNLTGGLANSVAVSSQAAHGTASASGISITYTPETGYSGTDSFTYTATNASGTSAPATVRIAVAAPSLVLAPAAGSLPNGIVGTAYAQAISASGGAAPYNFTAAGLPGGLTINHSNGTVTGIPTAAGSYPSTVTVTDAHGASGSVTHTIVIAVQAPVANAVTLTIAANSSANPVALTFTGGDAASVEIADQPAHGTATASGTAISYTPAAGYSGSDTFSYVATNGSGSSAPAAVKITVAAPALVIAAAAGEMPDGLVETAYSQVVSATGGSAPYRFSARGLPAGLTIDTGTGAVTGTPSTAGTYSVDFNVTDTNGATGIASFTIVVVRPAPPVAADSTSATVPANTKTEAGQNVGINLSSLVTGEYDEIKILTQPLHGRVSISRAVAMRGGGGVFAMAMSAVPLVQAPSQVIATYTPDPDYQGLDSFQFAAVGPGGASAPATVVIEVVGRGPTAQAKRVSAIDGQSVSVELTQGAANGPFIAAAIVSVSPSDQASATVVAGGTDTVRTFWLNVSPKAHFGGAITIAYTLTNAFGTSAPAIVTIEVTRRADPTADPVVQAISDAQAEATRRFARAQVSNFMRRSEALHGDCRHSSNGLRIASTDRSGGPEGEELDRGAAGRRAGELFDADLKNSQTERPHVARQCKDSVAVWTGGTVEVGTQDAVTGRSKISAATTGISGGVDVRLTKGLTIGVGAGVGHDRSRINDNKSEVAANATAVALYGSLVPRQGVFIDGMLSHGWLTFDSKRTDPTSNLLTFGKRDGRFTTVALSAGIDRVSGPLQWSVYGRADYLNGRLVGYREQGAGIYDLRFDAREIRSTSGVIGFRAAYRRPVVFGFITGGLRGEWQHEFTGGTAQGLDYADTSGSSFYSLAARGWGRDQFTLAPGIELILPAHWELGFNLGFRAASNERAASSTVQIRKKF